MPEHDESKTCQACGAFMNRYDTLCPICGAIAEEVLGEDIGDVNLRGAMDEVECVSCGAFVKVDTGKCSVCGEDIGLSLGDVDAELDAVETPEEPHNECPECGALQDNGSDECFLCGATIPVLDISIETLEPELPIEDKPELDEDILIDAAIEEEHNECPECGALQDNGSDECFLCGATIPIVAAPVEEPE
ncbi:MAG: zinc ribbon domain-containing protein, partial [Thermoplasmata archaeon]|nr:zinc ribbon domain-containing protein [Thermoplasmata archaeon]